MYKKVLAVMLSIGIASLFISCSSSKVPFLSHETEVSEEKEDAEENVKEETEQIGAKEDTDTPEPEGGEERDAVNKSDRTEGRDDLSWPENSGDQDHPENNGNTPAGTESGTAAEKEEPGLSTPQIDTGGTASYLGKEAEEKIKLLDTDYSKVNWGVRYAPIEDLPGIVVSIAPAKEHNGVNGLVIAVTNLYSEEISVAGGGSVKGLNGEEVGTFYLFADTIGTGSTFIREVYCDGIPSGEIHWDSLETMETSKIYIPWEADWTIGEKDGHPEAAYSIYANRPFKAGYIYGLLLDNAGNIVDIYSTTDYTETDRLEGTMRGYYDPKELGVADMALFANPISE